MNEPVKRTGSAVEAHYQFLLWLVPTVDRFPTSLRRSACRVAILEMKAWAGKFFCGR